MPLSNKQLGNLFIQGPNISIYPSGNSFVISGLSSGSGTIISGTNVGTNANSIGFFTGLSTTTNPNDTLAFRNLLAGDNITIAPSSTNDGDILISRGSPTLVNQILNIGGGSNVLSSITTTRLLAARTLLGDRGFTISTPASPTIVLISPTNVTASRFYISNAATSLTTSGFFRFDTTIGSMSIGNIATPTNTRLLIDAGSATISQLRFTAFSSEPTNPSDGSIWFSTSGNTLKFEKDTTPTDFIFKDNNISLTGLSNSVLQVDTAGTLSTKYINSFGLFNALSSVTIANTASETSIISSLITGSTTLLASTNAYNPELGVGRKFRFNAKGIIDTGDFVTLNIIIKLGSTIISSSSTITIGGGGPYSSEIEIDATFTIRNSGLVVGSGKILFLRLPPSTLGGDPVIFGIYSQGATIDTTSDKVFDCTAQFDTADPSNTITINESTLEILN